MPKERIIGKLHGKKKGPMLIVIGGMHGNERAGVTAIENIFDSLKKEAKMNKSFELHGTIFGLRGNRLALSKSQRYIKKDLNRQWEELNIHRIFNSPNEKLDEEDKEVKELLTTITNEIIREKPKQILFLDLHTTSADGGVFSIVDDNPESTRIAMGFDAPIIKGLFQIFKGTTLNFFAGRNLGIPKTAIAFEAGQHEDPNSVSRSEAAIMHMLFVSGTLKQRLNGYQHVMTGQHTSHIAEITYTHHIVPEDNFYMKAGYKNFQYLTEGEVIAFDKTGEIKAPYDCQILMPLYQKQGSDGFFLIKEIPTKS
jgi:succinylglutamate desuccinylase